MRARILAVLLLAGPLAGAASAGTLDRIRDTGVFHLGFRVDAAPFAHRDAIGEPAGYSVELCRRIAVEVKSTLGLDELRVDYVPVTAENRFDEVVAGRIDILCGPTTVTLSRRERVDFSVFTFVDGASVLYRVDGPANFEALAGHSVGVRAGTTTEEALRRTLVENGIDATVVAVESHPDGLARLEAGSIAAYFADRILLTSLVRSSAKPSELRLSDRYFTHEPYALALAKDDGEFRLVVDRTLSHLYRSGDIAAIFTLAFGGDAEPSDILEILYLLNGLAE